MIGRCDLFIKAHQKPGNLDQKVYLTPKHSLDSWVMFYWRRLLLAAMIAAMLFHLYMRFHEVDRATERQQFRLSWHRKVINFAKI